MGKRVKSNERIEAKSLSNMSLGARLSDKYKRTVKKSITETVVFCKLPETRISC